LLIAGLAIAHGGASPEPTGVGGSLPGMGTSVIRLLGAFALVIAMVLGGVWLARNWQRFATRKAGPRKLNVLEARMVGNRQSVFVVGYESHRYLLASSPSGIRLLAHLPSVEEGSDDEAMTPANVTPAFVEAFQQALGRGGR
jgi:flagellar biogenesis protein FliO